MKKMKLSLEQLAVDSFDTSAAPAKRGTVFGEQCTCPTNCTCPCMGTCAESCNGTCDYHYTCPATCYGGTCEHTCEQTCPALHTCDLSCYTCV
ncbi:MAG TPA: hypothetical protein VEQ60_18495 [Longimicrobium sp.]|nr:hypothetical protein [Longimicrobium sp.]